MTSTVKTSILVTGASGQLGSELHDLSKQFDDFEFHFYSKSKLDISNEKQLEQMVLETKCSYFINCAAYTAVDKAEREEALAYTINGHAVKNIAYLAAKHKFFVFQISTDYVYDSLEKGFILEDQELNPQSVYAKSKALGESNLTASDAEYIILRTSWVYSRYGKNFVKTMLRLMQERDELRIVNDQIGTPTYAKDLAEAIMHIISGFDDNLFPKQSGIYNYSNLGQTHWLGFAERIKALKNISCKLNGIKTSEYNAAAKRPLNSLLSKDKIVSTFQLEIPNWADSLRDCLDENDN